MGNGMSFKAGRDMPPGMQEKLALQLVADLQREYGVHRTDEAQAAVDREFVNNLQKKKHDDPEGLPIVTLMEMLDDQIPNDFMYRPPISIITEAMRVEAERLDEELGDAIYHEVIRYGINVDKEELFRALQYDRQQYEAGFQAGKSAAIEEVARRVPRFFVNSYPASDISKLDLNGPILVQADNMTITPLDSRWIPVSMRLPTEKDANEEGIVLVHNIGCPLYEAMDWDQVEIFRNSISHWMSLPEPPKGE